ncbi:unnamed protein product [Caenorhabditis brenneri]
MNQRLPRLLQLMAHQLHLREPSKCGDSIQCGKSRCQVSTSASTSSIPMGPQPVRRSVQPQDFYGLHTEVQGDALARNNAYSALASRARWGEKHRRMGEMQNEQWSRELIEPMGAAEYRRTMAELAER